MSQQRHTDSQRRIGRGAVRDLYEEWPESAVRSRKVLQGVAPAKSWAGEISLYFREIYGGRGRD